MTRFRFSPSRFLAVTALALASVASYAQPAVVSDLAVFKGMGAERAPVTAAKPGDTVTYVATYKNTGNQPALNLKATLAVPQGMEYIGPSAEGPSAVEASLDGQQFAAVPLVRLSKNSAGKEVSTPVPLGEYRALRWGLAELAPGSSISVELPAKVRSAP